MGIDISDVIISLCSGVECHGSSQEDSSSQHDPETHQPTTDVSTSTMLEVDDAILGMGMYRNSGA